MKNNYYEFRYLQIDSDQVNNLIPFEEEEININLLDLINKEDKILLLGNPGIGKTTELKRTFEVLWDNKDKLQIIPIYLNLKNFRNSRTIEDLIEYKAWINLSQIIFIFDGLDEISDIQDFISELEIFIVKYSNLKMKFLISCRTNIYEKYLIKIRGFIPAFLQNLDFHQIKRIFNLKYKIQIENEEINKFYSNISIPFNLDLFANFYLQNKSFPKSLGEAFEIVVNAQIDRAQEILKKRKIINKYELLPAFEKVAIAGELMQSNTIEGDHIFKLLGSKVFDFIDELPFLEPIRNSGNFTFVHKNYQEYFAAKYIFNMAMEEMIKFISADDLNKIKPTLFNTVTFLLNLLPDEKFEILKKWLFQNDIEILFFADKGRLDDHFKNQIFEKYFNEYCIDKTFWLSNNGKISSELLSEYAEFDFLLNALNQKSMLPRARLSALEVLTYKSLSSAQLCNFKEDLIILLNKEDDFFKSEILRSIKNKKIHIADEEFFISVLDTVKKIKERDVTHQIIGLISSSSEMAKYSETLMDVIRNHYCDTRDNVIRGTEQLVANIILQTSDSNLFLLLLEFLFDDKYNFRKESIYNPRFDEDLILKAKSFEKENEYVYKLIEYHLEGNQRYLRSELLDKIIEEIGFTEEILESVLAKHGLNINTFFIISKHLNEKSIDYLSHKFQTNELETLSDNDILSLRNNIAQNNYELAKYYEDKFREVGYEFNYLLKSEEEKKIHFETYEKFREYNFKMVFNKEELLGEIDKYFRENHIEVIENNKYYSYLTKWYDGNGYHGLIYTVHTVIERAMKRRNSITVEEISNMMNDDYFYLKIIKAVLTNRSSHNLIPSGEDFSLIEKLCKEVRSIINFDDVVHFETEDNDRFHINENYEYIKILLYFDINFEILQDQNFYLESLEYGNLAGNHGQDKVELIDHLKFRVEADDFFNERVVNNINFKRLTYSVQRDHIVYAIENNLKESFSKIGEAILEDKFLYDQNDILQNYVNIIDDASTFLKSCCSNIKSSLCWGAIRLLKEKKLEDKFIFDIAESYLNIDDFNHIEKAVNIYFYQNCDTALHKYNYAIDKFLENEEYSGSGFNPVDLINYSHTSELDLYEELFNKIFIENSGGSYHLHYSRAFMQSFTALICKYDDGYNFIIQILKKLKKGIEIDSNRAFYVNNLIEISENSYLQSKSPQKTFEEVLEILK